jgi:hypothetical protein
MKNKSIINIIFLTIIINIFFGCYDDNDNYDPVTRDIVISDLNLSINYTKDEAASKIQSYVRSKVNYQISGFSCNYGDENCETEAIIIWDENYIGYYDWHFDLYNALVSGDLPPMGCAPMATMTRYLLGKLGIETRYISFVPDYDIHPDFCSTKDCGHTAIQYINDNRQWKILDCTRVLEQDWLYFPVEWLYENVTIQY